MEIQLLKCVIVDDSVVQRTILSRIVKMHPNLSLEGCYRNGIDAKNKQVDKNADLILLDIEMPLINGFDLLDTLKEAPQIIIVSSKSEYALRAFEYNVTDYLMKPVDKKRFDKAINKALRNIPSASEVGDEDHFFVKSNFRKVKIAYNDIRWIEALGDYVKVVTEKTNHIVLTSMKAFEQQLPQEQFLRIHKSYIINLKRIEKFNNVIVEVGTKKIPISRRRKTSLLNALGVYN